MPRYAKDVYDINCKQIDNIHAQICLYTHLISIEQHMDVHRSYKVEKKQP